MPDAKVIIVTGASSGFGNLAARALARRGHIVYAGMRETAGRNAAKVDELRGLPENISGIEMDVQDQESVDAAIAQIVAEQQRIDVVVHNAGHMVLGPTEAYTPEQLAELYDINVVSTQRVNRAVLPVLRRQGSGHLVWIGSSSTRGGHPPFLAPYFAAKAGMDALAESYAADLIKFGIDTTIVVPGAYPSGTNHFLHASPPADDARAGEYDATYGRLREEMASRLAGIFPSGRGVEEVAEEIVRAIDQRPYRVHIDPSRDGSEVVSAVYDRIHAEFYHRIGIAELLPAHPSL
jgi:NAD(P)-dependent dehydrogenase (short-subunit alcohol dehydrogenase family)